jgi:TonB family protein
MKGIVPLVAWAGLSGLAAPAPPAPTPAEILTGERPLKILKYERPVFPLRMLREGVANGEVRLAVEISPEGEIVDWMATAYTHEDFAKATVEAVRSWIFRPTLVDGTPVTTVLELTVLFETNGVLLVERHTGISDRPLERLTYQPCSPRELDRPLSPVKRAAPSYPKQLGDMGVAGKVTVGFYVDEEGRVRMPVIAGQSNDYLASLAIEAVQQWRFAAPTRNGKPVIVRVSQDFNFVPAPEPAEKES